jgi:hypothetical protein
MGPEIFFLAVILIFILGFAGGDIVIKIEEQNSWKRPQRFTVRQVVDGTLREWVCARYYVSDGKISFLQEGHKERTVVAGQWHVEPFMLAAA